MCRALRLLGRVELIRIHVQGNTGMHMKTSRRGRAHKDKSESCCNAGVQTPFSCLCDLKT